MPPHPVEQPPDSALVAELRARIEALKRRLDQGHAERNRLLTMIAELQRALATRRQPERRPWPGLRAWLRKV